MHSLNYTRRLALCAVLSLAATAIGQAAETLWKAKNIPWADTPEIKGAKNARLWDQGALHRLPINMVLTGAAQPQATQILVTLGAISVEIAGKPSGEFGPGSFVSIPSGAKYALTATAAGECTFLLQNNSEGGDREVLSRAKNISWADTPSVKGAKNAQLWNGAALHRLPINMVLPGEAGSQGARLLVTLGAISVEIAGRPSGEFGPGSFISIPAGAKYALTATAAGECTFLLQ
jgi:quercetin dioxygenase-like cupin family protein